MKGKRTREREFAMIREPIETKMRGMDWILLDQLNQGPLLRPVMSSVPESIRSRTVGVWSLEGVEGVMASKAVKPLIRTEPFQKECSATGRFISRGVEVELNAFWTSTRLKNVPWSIMILWFWWSPIQSISVWLREGTVQHLVEPFWSRFFYVFFFVNKYMQIRVFFDGFCMHRRIEVDDARNSNSVNAVLPSLSGSLQEPRSGRILRAAGSHGAVAEMEVCHAEATRHTCTNLDRQQTATRLTNSKLPANVEFWIVSSSYLRMISWCILMIKCTSVCNQSDLRTLGLTHDFLFQKSSL